jgi:large subunit ribosomal protein L24
MLTGHIRRHRRLERAKVEEAKKFRTMPVKKGDTVKVLAGKSKGRTGRVMLVYPETERVLVERVNMVKRHQRPTQRLQKGGIIEKENPLHISNVRLVCPRCGQTTAARREEVGEKRVRVCKKCDEQIDRA